MAAQATAETTGVAAVLLNSRRLVWHCATAVITTKGDHDGRH